MCLHRNVWQDVGWEDSGSREGDRMSNGINGTLASVTEEIIERSKGSRKAYLAKMAAGKISGSRRRRVSCGNWAHSFAIYDDQHKEQMKDDHAHLGIVTAYNDMLSAHQPYERYPGLIRHAASRYKGTVQVAGGVPAMCDGVTQGQKGMELSLISRDVIAMATAVSLSHNVFDGGLLLGICDKIVPGLLIGALKFGYLPMAFVPSGPMSSGIPNKEKAKVRQAFAEGEVGEDALLDVECKSYHSSGTCTFYGTANSNQILMEAMGLHLPGAAFVAPDSDLRDALTDQVVGQIIENSRQQRGLLMDVVTEKSLVNAIVALLATGGSTNLTIHLLAIGRSAGIQLQWNDIARLSEAVPLLCRMYPNGEADVNHFHNAGGTPFLFKQLLDLGLMHGDVMTLVGNSLHDYCKVPHLNEGKLSWHDTSKESSDESVLREAHQPFDSTGGIKQVQGNLGVGITKISAIAPENRLIRAKAMVFEDQNQVLIAHKQGLLERDFVLVLRYQGPRANGMPELHKLMPVLGALQDKGFKVALVTDGRLSGASGKVPNVIHITPEALLGGELAKIRNGDEIEVDLEAGTLNHFAEVVEFQSRIVTQPNCHNDELSLGTELFDRCREMITGADEGASFLV